MAISLGVYSIFRHTHILPRRCRISACLWWSWYVHSFWSFAHCRKIRMHPSTPRAGDAAVKISKLGTPKWSNMPRHQNGLYTCNHIYMYSIYYDIYIYMYSNLFKYHWNPISQKLIPSILHWPMKHVPKPRLKIGRRRVAINLEASKGKALEEVSHSEIFIFQ